MKPIFKTTALAAFVALSLTACSSGGGSDNNNSAARQDQVEVQTATTSAQARQIVNQIAANTQKARVESAQAARNAQIAKSTVNRVQTTVDALKKRVAAATNETQKAELEKTLKDKETELATAQKGLADAQAKADQAKKSVEEHTKALEKATKQVADLQQAEQKAAEAKAKAEKEKAELEAKQAAEAKKKAEEEAKRKAEEQKRLEAEAKQKAEEAKKARDQAEKERLEREAKAKEEEAKRVADAKRKAEEEARRKAEEQKRLEEEAKKNAVKPTPTNPTADFNATKTVNGKEWRYIDMGNKYGNWGMNGELIYMPLGMDTQYGRGAGVVNFNKLSNNQLGKFSGKATDQDYVVYANSDADTKNGMNYIFVNQPYSTYGILYVPNKKEPNKLIAQHVGFTRIADDDSKLSGNATYKGGVIAQMATYERRAIAGDETLENVSTTDEKTVIKDDGTVLVNVKVDGTTQKLMMDGLVKSTTIGDIKLSRHEIEDMYDPTSSDGYQKNKHEVDRGVAIHDRGTGVYEATFGGKGYSDVVGAVSLFKPTDGVFNKNDHNQGLGEIKENGKTYIVTEYKAAFGATKQ